MAGGGDRRTDAALVDSVVDPVFLALVADSKVVADAVVVGAGIWIQRRRSMATQSIQASGRSCMQTVTGIAFTSQSNEAAIMIAIAALTGEAEVDARQISLGLHRDVGDR